MKIRLEVTDLVLQKDVDMDRTCAQQGNFKKIRNEKYTYNEKEKTVIFGTLSLGKAGLENLILTGYRMQEW